MTKINNNYPRFISHTPRKSDGFENQSHALMAEAIKKHICESNNGEGRNYNMIGVEGAWGTGKSNLIYLIEEKLKNDLFGKKLFLFDLWSYQGSLDIRFFLKSLITELLEEKLLNGYDHWKKQLKIPFTKMNVKTSVNQPEIKRHMILLILGLITLSPVMSLVLYLSNLFPKTSLFVWMIPSIFLFTVIIISLILMFFKEEIFKELLSLFHFQTALNFTETTQEFNSDFTSIDAQKIMNEISRSLNRSMLIVVIDNIDRISDKNMDKAWSLINTIAIDQTQTNIWYIIPYDKMRILDEIYEDQHKSELIQAFIDKVLPINYKLPEPIFTDYQTIFEKLFYEAFSDNVNLYDIEKIRILYNEIHPRVAIRSMINFINEIVLLQKQHDNEKISLITIAVFVLSRNVIHENPREKLVTIDFLEEVSTQTEEKLSDNNKKEYENNSQFHSETSEILIKKQEMEKYDFRHGKKGLLHLISPDENFLQELTALYYNVNLEAGEQLLLYLQIEKDVESIDLRNINYGEQQKFCAKVENTSFDKLLSLYAEKVNGSRLNALVYYVDRLIDAYNSEQKKYLELLKKLCQKKCDTPIYFYEMEDTTDILLVRLKDERESLRKLVAHIIKQTELLILQHNDENWAKNYYTSIHRLLEIKNKCNFNVDLNFDLIQITDFKALENYVCEAKLNYPQYLKDESQIINYINILFTRTFLEHPIHISTNAIEFISYVSLYTRLNVNFLFKITNKFNNCIKQLVFNARNGFEMLAQCLPIYKQFCLKTDENFNTAIIELLQRFPTEFEICTRCLNIYLNEKIENLENRQNTNNFKQHIYDLETVKRTISSYIILNCCLLYLNKQIFCEFPDIQDNYSNDNDILNYIKLVSRKLLKREQDILESEEPFEEYFIQMLNEFEVNLNNFSKY